MYILESWRNNLLRFLESVTSIATHACLLPGVLSDAMLSDVHSD
jgi:hypothetical protein